MFLLKLLRLFKKSKEEKVINLKCEIASMKREVEVMWMMENGGGYLFGQRDEIISIEKSLVYKKKELEILEKSIKDKT